MPFKSDKQRKWMWANDPEMAKKWEKEEQKEAVQVDIDKVLKNTKIKQLLKRLKIKTDKTEEAALKILNYLARNPHAFAAVKVAFESVKEERDYKAEYKKYGSSTKAKKYRAELNQYNRKKGTYGNGDGKDASHKGGKIVGFEKESKNRGRAEKSRLKQETVNEVGELIPKTKVRLLKMNAKYLADDLMDMYKELGRKHADISPALIIQHLDTLKDKVKMMRKNVGLRESINEGFDKYHLGGLLDSKLKKRLERTIKIIGGKVDAVGDDYIKFRMGSMDLNRLPAVIKKLDRNKNVWIGDKRKNNIWDRRRNIDRLESVNEAGGVVTARIQQKPRGYWAVFNKKGESQFEGNKRFMIKILKKASTLSPNAIGSILDRARPGAKHLEFKAQFSRYYYNETVEEMLNPPNYLDNQAPTPVNSPEDENLVSRGKRTKKSGQPKFGTFRNESVNEKISKEEWAEYPKYARKLKPYMKRLLKIPVKVRVIKQANHNPWIEVRVARFGKDVIPNDFRVKAAKNIGARSVRDWDNVNYGNITAGSVSMYHSDWVKLLGNKVR